MAKSTVRTVGATIRSEQGGEIKVYSGALLQEFAVRWSYLIRNRSHWSQADAAKMSERLRSNVRQLGFTDEELKPFRDARLIEVDVAFRDESVNWESRILPWEFVLARAFPRSPGAPNPVVVRRLRIKSRSASTQHDWSRSLAYIESAPGNLGSEFTFARERSLVSQSLVDSQWKGAKFELFNPTLEDIKRRLLKAKPLIVHITGLDNHQGSDLLGEEDGRFNDGMYLRSPRTMRAVQVPATELAMAVGSAQPTLVGLNLFHSAPRIAPLLLAAGAESVVAFQDTIDDALSEIFFAEFYSKWAQKRSQDSPHAFCDALTNIMRGGTSMAGAGIVLWSLRSLLPTKASRKPKTDSPLEVSTSPSVALESFRPVDDNCIDWEQHLSVKIEPRKEVNYALLHNGRSLFHQFYLHNRTNKRLEGLQVRLVLSLGDLNLEQSKKFTMTGAGLDLRTELPLSLISAQLRRFREAVYTSLKIAIDCQGKIILDQNYPLRILPINEWSDTDDERHWLPSFVQPRDLAVTKIKDRAKLWLKRLTSDHTSGFDGYQQVDAANEDTWSAVTHQVEAIWDALAYDHALVYTNPPPTYSTGAQRIRSPSEILDSRTGTCLDLTVLLAACLEEIDIYPVVFLLKGHAFPGYWQSDIAHQQFWGGWDSAVQESVGGGTVAAKRGRMDAQDQKHQWMLNKSGFDHMLDAIQRGHLVPIESVWLTSERKLDEAIEAGGENLIDRREFECMIDVIKARRKNVLPLPEKN